MQKGVINRALNWGIAAGLLLALVLGYLTQQEVAEFGTDGEFDSRLITLGLLDFLLALVLVTALIQKIAWNTAQGRNTGVESPLHLRLSRVFAIAAFVPTVIVAVVAALTVSIGLGDWLSGEVEEAFDEVEEASATYVEEKIEELRSDVERLVAALNGRFLAAPGIEMDGVRRILQEEQNVFNFDIKFAFVIDGACNIVARGVKSYKFDYVPPPANLLQILDRNGAESGAAPSTSSPECGMDTQFGTSPEFQISTADPTWLGPEESPNGVIYRSDEGVYLSALVRLDSVYNMYLVASKIVSAPILDLYDSLSEQSGKSEATVRQLGSAILNYSIIYLGIGFLLVFVTGLVGIWFAERLSRPVEKLANAAERVGEGNLDESLEIQGQDEFAKFGHAFNAMTAQLKVQRDNLIMLRDDARHRERSFRSVLSNVTAGVIGLDADEKIVFMNRSAGHLLNLEEQGFNAGESNYKARLLRDTVPEFASLFDMVKEGDDNTSQRQIRIDRRDRHEDLLVRVATRRTGSGKVEGYVAAFDDVTDLVRAESKAAWSIVAQRIAHEIKNPLTPIMLCLSQLRNRVGPKLDKSGQEKLEDYLELISRNLSGLARICEEFSKFARMPDPVLRKEDITRLVEMSADLQSERDPSVDIKVSFAERPIYVQLDGDLISQAITNLVKNAGESLRAHRHKFGDSQDYHPQIRIEVSEDKRIVEIRVMDNGIGFPKDRAKLLEPFISSREGGTGLGLPNVLRIVEGHSGTLELSDAPLFGESSKPGAMITIKLPSIDKSDYERDDTK